MEVCLSTRPVFILRSIWTRAALQRRAGLQEGGRDDCRISFILSGWVTDVGFDRERRGSETGGCGAERNSKDSGIIFLDEEEQRCMSFSEVCLCFRMDAVQQGFDREDDEGESEENTSED
ncbi:hypothetical protein F7725_017899 [Dissostichus mawsoni]|uniref:Uncharacterized protein n=1 Tax=Dissostichus mawsoni TaxID=36200 RepID=A0A7J5XQ37_DISMA|nr:hypothetical protein F7725_017899 [Dissostichus mawsoni]